jgi:hypothetical protein
MLHSASAINAQIAGCEFDTASLNIDGIAVIAILPNAIDGLPVLEEF